MENETSLSKIGEPDCFEIIPGLVLEDKLRIKTQRRLEKHFNLPISRIFPGQTKNLTTGKLERWDGINFDFLDNSIPLITILAQQVDDSLTEGRIEEILESAENENLLAENLEKYFLRLRPKKPKNSRGSNQKKR